MADIKPWQHKSQFSVRLQTSGAPTMVQLPKQYAHVVELRLAEQSFVGFNGGVSATAYLRADVQGLTSPMTNNENVPGATIHVDVLNPQLVYGTPRVVAVADGIVLNRFELGLRFTNSIVPLFTEATFVFDVVMKKPVSEAEAFRRQMAMWVGGLPAIKGPDPRTEYGEGKF